MLDPATWRARATAHAARADDLTAGHRDRRARGGERHAIEDFLFEYYPAKPAQLRRWHPGAGAALAGAADAPHAAWRWYRADLDGTVALDVPAFLADRGDTVRYVRALLSATAARPAATGCFGLHEWAMVYREGDGEHRHPLPLRLGGAGTDAVVERHRIRCTHIDAFRFFTPDAVPRNTLQPTRESQVAMEQPGCLHANMDMLKQAAHSEPAGDSLPLTRETQIHYEQPGCLHAAMDCYKWALKLGPLVPGELLLDSFELSLEIRYTDMQASPYDVSSYGLESIKIETAEGKQEYVRRQRDYAVRSNVLRARLVKLCDLVLPEGGSR
ncbi:3-methyladenine DNA glycosylase [Cellulomonas pakistanensis]|uniref:3-methyladenine DNA glycosylase n=1 Tax=Cellulomonas pakistanensis TaxID=992287 RepID=UPI0019412088|nr:3-methyladenine DNA glycosylase [Cellulomonas pakistanensis]